MYGGLKKTDGKIVLTIVNLRLTLHETIDLERYSVHFLEKSNYTKVCKQELYKVIFGWQQSAVKVLTFFQLIG